MIRRCKHCGRKLVSGQKYTCCYDHWVQYIMLHPQPHPRKLKQTYYDILNEREKAFTKKLSQQKI